MCVCSFDIKYSTRLFFFVHGLVSLRYYNTRIWVYEPILLEFPIFARQTDCMRLKCCYLNIVEKLVILCSAYIILLAS